MTRNQREVATAMTALRVAVSDLHRYTQGADDPGDETSMGHELARSTLLELSAKASVAVYEVANLLKNGGQR